ncbi:MAG: phosphatase PAP2 family protein [Bacteroidales bacterium]|nr:phosphatase PAP2 family protein [Bacteroidales bacterium]
MEGAAGLTLLREAHHIDQDVTLAINSLHAPFTDSVWQLFSNKEIWFVLYAAVLVFLYIRLGWKRATIVVLSCILTIVACDQFANFTKDFFERLRPCWDLNMVDGGLHVLEDKGNLYGFYSAHAANAMGFAVCSYLGFRNDRSRRYRGYAWGIFPWALLVGLSRVFVGKHFLGDVLTGFFFGLLSGGILALLARWIIGKTGLSAHGCAVR